MAYRNIVSRVVLDGLNSIPDSIFKKDCVNCDHIVREANRLLSKKHHPASSIRLRESSLGNRVVYCH